MRAPLPGHAEIPRGPCSPRGVVLCSTIFLLADGFDGDRVAALIRTSVIIMVACASGKGIGDDGANGEHQLLTFCNDERAAVWYGRSREDDLVAAVAERDAVAGIRSTGSLSGHRARSEMKCLKYRLIGPIYE